MLIGLVLAGGKSSRFGRDKGLVALDGKPLVGHVHEALTRDCDRVLVSGGQAYAALGFQTVPDHPEPGHGPLGGILGGLEWLRRNAPDALLLSAPCDSPDLPEDLATRLREAGAPALVADHYTHALWPLEAADIISRHLSEGNRRMRSVHDALGSTSVRFDHAFRNVNRVEDLVEPRIARPVAPRSKLE